MSFSPLSLAFSIALCLLPHLVTRMADTGASIVARRGGTMIDWLRANMIRLTGNKPSAHGVRDMVRSHVRNYAEQLMLESRRGEPLLKGISFEGFKVLAMVSEDGPVVLALGHPGSWDRAGAWVCTHGRGIVTVAEKVESPALFGRFVSLREGLGVEIIDVVKGEPVFSTLIERVRGRSVTVPLLADKDISDPDIEVDLGARCALVAAGPTALVTELERPPPAVCITCENETPTGADVRVRCVGLVNADGQEHPDLDRVEVLTQARVDEFATMMVIKAQDWHMIQRIYVEDLDPERLARARIEHKRKNR